MFVFECYGDHRELHVLTHSFPPRRASDLPEDYKHFSQTFTMDESTANEMNKDGGTPLAGPVKDDPNAAILTADALPGDTAGAILTATDRKSTRLNSSH